MAQDAKGVAFGQGNRGYATILRPDTRGFLDTVNKLNTSIADAARKGAEARKKAAKDKVKLIDPKSIYSKFERDINDDYLPRLLDGAVKGTMSDAEIVRLSAEMVNRKNAGKNIQDRVLKGSSILKADKEVINGDQYIQNQLANIKTADLDDYESGAKTFDPMGFVNEDGGSQFLDTDEVLKNFTKEQADVSYSRASDGKLKVNPDGFVTQDSFGKEVKLSNYVEYNDVTKKLRVKDPQGLIDDGVLDIAKTNPKLNRILIDRTRDAIERMKSSGVSEEEIDNRIEEIEATVFAHLLEGREKGSVSRKFSRRTVARPDRGSGSSDSEINTFYRDATGVNGQEGYDRAEGRFTGMKGKTSLNTKEGKRKGIDFEVQDARYESPNSAYVVLDLGEDITDDLYNKDGVLDQTKYDALRRKAMRDLGLSENALIDRGLDPLGRQQGYEGMRNDLKRYQLEINFDPNKLDQATFFKNERPGRTYKPDEEVDRGPRLPGSLGNSGRNLLIGN